MLNDIGWMRTVIEEMLLPDSCNILSGTRTSDSAGGWTNTWGTATGGTAVACRVDYTARGGMYGGPGKEVVTGGALVPYQSAVISLPYDVTITPANRIEVGTDVFSVQAVNNGQSAKAVTRCTCQLVP